MSKFVTYQLAFIVAILVILSEVHGHGMMLDPASRSSRWRIDNSAPTNYDDNALYCGGFSSQWGKNGGKCGLCGDDYSMAAPRPNELGGRYGQGVIVRSYVGTYTAYLGIRITANHLGFFYFNICNLDEFGGESEACFNKYRIMLADGSDKLYIGSATGWVNATIVFPEGLNCDHCVLRWNYQGGNNWGYCEDGSGAKGCGPQENFKGCADISVSLPLDRSLDLSTEVVDEKILKPSDDIDDAPVDLEEV